MKEEISYYDKALAGEWKEGKGALAKAWRRKYPDIFDADDLRLVSNQPTYHFLEWLAAIQYFERGYLALVEQYIYKTHPRKVAIVQDLVGPEGLTFLKDKRSQPPDLLVYTRSRSDFFFAEVKRRKEKLNPRQEEAFAQIESYFGREITVLRLYAQKAQEGSKNDD